MMDNDIINYKVNRYVLNIPKLNLCSSSSIEMIKLWTLEFIIIDTSFWCDHCY
jgi:hypothetical protein